MIFSKKLSVIIVAYNCLEDMKKCINSINKYNDIGDMLEIIIVDNSPDCNVYNYLKGNYSDIISIKNINNGFGAGNNVGYFHSHGEYLLFLNPDTLLVEPVFNYAIQKFESDEMLGLFGVQLVNSNMKENSSFDIRMSHGIIHRLVIKACRKFGIFLSSIMYPSGADIFIRRSDFENCGKFDENIFLYGEESDICYRINSLGKKVGYFKEKKIIHLQGKSTGNNFEKKFQEMLKSQKYLCEKHNINYFKIVVKELRYYKCKKILDSNGNLILYDKVIKSLVSESHRLKNNSGNMI